MSFKGFKPQNSLGNNKNDTRKGTRDLRSPFNGLSEKPTNTYGRKNKSAGHLGSPYRNPVMRETRRRLKDEEKADFEKSKSILTDLAKKHKDQDVIDLGMEDKHSGSEEHDDWEIKSINQSPISDRKLFNTSTSLTRKITSPLKSGNASTNTSNPSKMLITHKTATGPSVWNASSPPSRTKPFSEDFSDIIALSNDEDDDDDDEDLKEKQEQLERQKKKEIKDKKTSLERQKQMKNQRSKISGGFPVPASRSTSSFNNFFQGDMAKRSSSINNPSLSKSTPKLPVESETSDRKKTEKPKVDALAGLEKEINGRKLDDFLKENSVDMSEESRALYNKALRIAEGGHISDDSDSFIGDDDDDSMAIDDHLVADRGYDYYVKEQRRIIDEGRRKKYPETLDFPSIHTRVVTILEEVKRIIEGDIFSYHQEIVLASLSAFLRHKLLEKRIVANGFQVEQIKSARQDLPSDSEQAAEDKKAIRKIVQGVEHMSDWGLACEYRSGTALSVKEILALRLRSDAGYYGPATKDLIIKMVSESCFDQLSDIATTHRRRKLRSAEEIRKIYEQQQKKGFTQSFTVAHSLKTDSMSSIPRGSSTSEENPLSQLNLSQSDVSQSDLSQQESQQPATRQSTLEQLPDTQPETPTSSYKNVAKSQETVMATSQSSFVLPPPPNLWWINVFGIPNYISYILSPEIITRLIGQDIKDNVNAARDVLQESTAYGNVKFPVRSIIDSSGNRRDSSTLLHHNDMDVDNESGFEVSDDEFEYDSMDEDSTKQKGAEGSAARNTRKRFHGSKGVEGDGKGPLGNSKPRPRSRKRKPSSNSIPGVRQMKLTMASSVKPVIVVDDDIKNQKSEPSEITITSTTPSSEPKRVLRRQPKKPAANSTDSTTNNDVDAKSPKVDVPVNTKEQKQPRKRGLSRKLIYSEESHHSSSNSSSSSDEKDNDNDEDYEEYKSKRACRSRSSGRASTSSSFSKVSSLPVKSLPKIEDKIDIVNLSDTDNEAPTSYQTAKRKESNHDSLLPEAPLQATWSSDDEPTKETDKLKTGVSSSASTKPSARSRRGLTNTSSSRAAQKKGSSSGDPDGGSKKKPAVAVSGTAAGEGTQHRLTDFFGSGSNSDKKNKKSVPETEAKAAPGFFERPDFSNKKEKEGNCAFEDENSDDEDLF